LTYFQLYFGLSPGKHLNRQWSLPFPGYWKNRLGLMTPTNPWIWMVFDEALFSITFDRIASRLFSISNAIYSYSGACKPRRHLECWSRIYSSRQKNLPLKDIDSENPFPQAYGVDCFNQFNRGCVFSDNTRSSFCKQILRRASSNAVPRAFSPDLRSRIDYSRDIILRAKKMVLMHGSHSPPGR
jgi:hypothetical protein